MKKIYAAYGSNIHPSVIKKWAPDCKEVGVGIIRDYALLFRGGLATIEPFEGKFVPIKLYEITEEDEKGLDEYEGYAHGLYDKITLPIEVKQYDDNYLGLIMSPQEAMFYIMNKKYDKYPPDREYLQLILSGYFNTEAKYKQNLFTVDILAATAIPYEF